MFYDVVCFPVSAILRGWHDLFGPLLGSSAAWPLAVVFLVFTLRALLVRLALGQLRATRAMQAAQPRFRALKEKHRGDRATLAAETQKLQRELGLNPLGGCLPALVQLPVFLGLLHVLHQFVSGTAAYGFDTGDVRSFLAAKLVTAPLAAYVRMPQARLDALGGAVDRWQVAAVAVPLAALAAVATWATTRHALRRQPPADPQSALVGRLMLWGLPAGALIGGVLFAFPVVTLLYWLANNLWTLGQQAVLHRVLDRQPTKRQKGWPAGSA
jgi:YidC/Oxa1 family membrane protein insertase